MSAIIKLTIATTIYFLAIFIAQANDYVFTSVNVSHGLSDNQIRYILQLPDGRMVFTTSGNVNIYDGARFKYLHRTPQQIYPLSKYDGFYRIYQEGDSLLWIKDSNKLQCLNLYKEEYITDIKEYFEKQGIREPVDDFFVDDQNRLWLLTSKGLLKQDTSNIFDLSANSGNLQDLVTAHNKLYLFYNTGEVVCYDIKTKKKLYSTSAYPIEEQEKFKNTSLVVKGDGGFYQLRNGSKGGFFFFDYENRKWEKILETDYTLNTMIVTPDETALISCPQGIWKIDCRNGDKQYIPVLKTVEGDIIDTEISTLFYDKQGGLWLGTLNRGLLYYHPSRYKFTHIGRSYFTEFSSRDILVQAFGEDKAGNIYLKCNSKYYQFHPPTSDNKCLTPVTESSLSKDVLTMLTQNPPKIFRGKYYTALCTDSRGWTWGGTQDGLKLFVPDTQDERILYTEDGLCNNFVQAILEDRDHHIWVTTSYGISQIRVDSTSSNIRFTNFNTYDGTLDGEYLQESIFESSDGALYFGGIDGFNILHPTNLSFPDLPFKPVFTDLRLRGEEVKVGKEYDGSIILAKATPYTKEIELSYYQNFITFAFSNPNYQNQSQTSYRYQLEGIDAHWIDTSTKGQEEIDGILRVSYTNLPPGKYTLRVMSSDNNGEWSGDVSELNIIVHAPWWKTTTAYCLYALFLLLTISGCIYIYTYLAKKRLKRQHKEEILLLRVRNLIEQCNQNEAAQKSHPEEDKEYPANINEVSSDDNDTLSSSDSIFLAHAIEMVEKNLDEPDYSVEQLSRDLCMDRTGLYRKLIALLDKSPSLFIRNIRLQRAAQLIVEGKFSIADIADMVGFSSSSYLSKCFQEMYGCRPSEYVEKGKKST